MPELLAPAGSMEALISAVNSGCDAVYLGASKFGARAYASNFDFDTLQKAIEYCHLHNVKVHVTMNTIVFEDELEEAYNQIIKLYQMGVDAVIIQDIALLDYVKRNCPLIEAHASTQMGLDDSYGAKQANLFGAKRVVLGRECSLEKIKEIKSQTNLPVEVFGHGALCVSYSGNCLMSGLIGYRSGNRGRCVGSCRKPYELINLSTCESLGTSYILSMKDLSTVDKLEDLSFVDSIKIEGRMKEPTYVANVVKEYRYALDNHHARNDAYSNLEKTFNRTFTNGYIFSADKKDIVNIKRPNHVGYKVGYVSGIKKGFVEITLNKNVNQNDVIRIEGTSDITYPLTKIYDEKGNLINSSDKRIYIKLQEEVNIGNLVYVTSDVKYLEHIALESKKNQRKIPINMFLEGKISNNLKLQIICGDYHVEVISDFIVEKSLKNQFSYDNVYKQLSRLNDTPYEIETLECDTNEYSFIPSSKLNELRREGIEKLNIERLKIKRPIDIKEESTNLNVSLSDKGLTVFCQTKDQYEAAISCGIKEEDIYFDNYFRRNECTYKDKLNNVTLVGGYGGINYYKDKNTYLVSDFSLNVVNSRALYLLHKEGVKRITISHEINKSRIDKMILEFKRKYNTLPNLEMIVYGRAHLLNTKYCPLKVYNLCGKCKNNQYVIKDNYGEFPIISHNDCTTTIVNGKILNLLDELPYLNDAIRKYRIQLTIESKEETINIINKALSKLNGNNTKEFNPKTDTRGHFNKDIL